MTEMCFYRKEKDRNYTTISNVCLRDAELSMKAKGLFCYLLSLPADWEIYTRELKKHFPDGEAALRSAIRDLTESGYIKKERKRGPDGKFCGYVYMIIEDPDEETSDKESFPEKPDVDKPNEDKPQAEKPNVDNPNVEKPHVENRTLLSTNSTNNLLNTPVGNASDGGDDDKKSKDEVLTLSADELFEKAYKLYPRKEGKTEGKQLYISYLTSGRKIKGQPRHKFNHGQLSVAIQIFSREMEGRDSDKIQLFSTFMKKTVIDYIEKTREQYEVSMKTRYGDGWEKQKFVYEIT